MSGGALTTASTLLCPHGGSVSAVPGSAQVKAAAPVLRSSDTFTIAGCPFNVSSVASPCVRVSWIVSDTRVTAGGASTLSQSSVGLCLNAAGAPQGPVVVASTQPRVQSS
jgi:hypothetical protein